MWLVRIALKRPYTFVVMAMLIVILGVLSICGCRPTSSRTSTSRSSRWSGTTAACRPRRWRSASSPTSSASSRRPSTTSSTSRASRSPASRSSRSSSSPARSIEAATAQVTAISQTAVRQMPPGATPPLIIRYSASNVPILQLALESDTLSEQQLFDYGIELHPRRHRDDAGRADPVAVRRQAAPDHGRHRSRSGSTRCGLSPRDVQRRARRCRTSSCPTGTAKIGRQRVPGRRSTAAPRRSRSSARSADQDGQRHDGLHPRRRQRARRQLAADQHGPRRGQALGADDDPEERRAPARSTSSTRITRRCCRAIARAGCPKELQGHAAVRSVGVRARGGRRRGARRRRSPPASPR